MTMKILCISDTHNKHKQLRNLPSADVIVHAGDFSSMGYEWEIKNFLNWFSKLPYSYKIFIAGNHDWLFENNSILAKSLVPENVIYLEDDGIEIDGVKFWGTPVQPIFCNWAFNRSEEKLIRHWQAIPDNTDVLITHCPPHTILDLCFNDNAHKGSPSLYYEIFERIKPKLNVMGHIHEGYEIKVIDDVTFINASVLDENYVCVNKPILIELVDGIVKRIDY